MIIALVIILVMVAFAQDDFPGDVPDPSQNNVLSEGDDGDDEYECELDANDCAFECGGPCIGACEAKFDGCEEDESDCELDFGDCAVACPGACGDACKSTFDACVGGEDEDDSLSPPGDTPRFIDDGSEDVGNIQQGGFEVDGQFLDEDPVGPVEHRESDEATPPDVSPSDNEQPPSDESQDAGDDSAGQLDDELKLKEETLQKKMEQGDFSQDVQEELKEYLEITEEIVEITKNEEDYIVHSKVEGKLFGFIPVSIPISRTINGNLEITGEKRPWYSFLVSE